MIVDDRTTMEWCYGINLSVCIVRHRDILKCTFVLLSMDGVAMTTGKLPVEQRSTYPVVKYCWPNRATNIGRRQE